MLGLAVGFLPRSNCPSHSLYVYYFALRRQAILVEMKLMHLAGFDKPWDSGTWGVPALVQTNGLFAREGLGTHVVERGLSAFNNRSYTPLFYFFDFFKFFSLVASGLWKISTFQKSRQEN